MKGDSGNTAGPGLNTGGAGPAPSKDWKKNSNVSAGRTGSGATNPGNSDGGLGDAKPVWSGAGADKGYTVISESPVQDRPQEYSVVPTRRTYGIDRDTDYCGSYTGGSGNKKAT